MKTHDSAGHLQHDESIRSVTNCERERQRLQSAQKEFLQRGGVINVIPIGVGSNAPAIPGSDAARKPGSTLPRVDLAAIKKHIARHPGQNNAAHAKALGMSESRLRYWLALDRKRAQA